MTAIAYERPGVEFDPIRDRSYRNARLGPDVAAFLAWFELGGASPHTARHTFATRWRRRGLAADDLSILLGHESVRTTSDLYVQIEVADVAARMALIEAGERL